MSDSLLTKGSVIIHAIVITTALAIVSGNAPLQSLPSNFSQFQIQAGR